MVLWGLAIPIAKRGFQDGLTPSTFLFGRFLLAAIFSLPIFIAVKPKPNLKSISKIFLLEILGTVLSLWLLYEGVARTSGIEASLIAITWPILVTIGGVLLLREKEEFHEILGLILAIAGTTLLVLIPLANGGTSAGTLIGNSLIILQNIAIAAYYLIAKKVYTGLNKWAVVHISFWVGIAGFTLIQLLQGGLSLPPLSFWPLFAIVYMAIGGSILGLTLYLIGQDKIEASEAAVFTYLEPLIGIPASMFLLGEHVTLTQIIATLVIAAGVYLVEIRPRKKLT